MVQVAVIKTNGEDLEIDNKSDVEDVCVGLVLIMVSTLVPTRYYQHQHRYQDEHHHSILSYFVLAKTLL